jgi:hypothetical protein
MANLSVEVHRRGPLVGNFVSALGNDRAARCVFREHEDQHLDNGMEYRRTTLVAVVHEVLHHLDTVGVSVLDPGSRS